MKLHELLRQQADRLRYDKVLLCAALKQAGHECTPETVQNWLDGVNPPRYEALAPLSKILKIDPRVLIHGEGNGR